MSSYRLSVSGQDRTESISRGGGAMAAQYSSKIGDAASLHISAFGIIEILLPKPDLNYDSGSYIEEREKDGVKQFVLVIKGPKNTIEGGEARRGSVNVTIGVNPGETGAWPSIGVDVRKAGEKTILSWTGETVKSVPVTAAELAI